LGRGQDLNKLATFLQYLQPLGAEIIQSEMNIGDYIDRLGASLGIDTNGLIKSDEQKAQEAEQATQQQQAAQMMSTVQDMAGKATPEMAKAMMAQQQQETQQG
jgi:hypothetical protein